MSVDARDQTRLIAQVLNSHLQHDLTLQDREVLKKASKQCSSLALTYIPYSRVHTVLFCALGGVVIGSVAAARFTFVGKYHPRNLRKLPSIYNRQTNKFDQAVFKDRLAFFGRAFVMSSIGLIAGTQLGVSAGYYLSNRTLDREGDRDKITRAMMAAQNELKEKLGLKDSRMKQLPEEVDGENTSLASGWEREQVVSEEPTSEFVEDGKKQRYIPPPISSGRRHLLTPVTRLTLI